MIPAVRWLKFNEIKARAERVLEKFHASRELPIPVDDIVDVGLGIDIFPLPGLRVSFDFDAFLSNDLMRICVDEYVYTHYENRYRFTLAHEIGHLCLHDYVYKACPITCVDDFHRFNEALDAEQKRKMEWQANRFAGYLLAPDSHVISCWDRCRPALRAMTAEAKEHGFRPEEYRDMLVETAGERMCPDFEVSAESMKFRLFTALDDHVLSLPP